MSETTFAVVGGILISLWMIVTLFSLAMQGHEIKEIQEKLERLRRR